MLLTMGSSVAVTATLALVYSLLVLFYFVFVSNCSILCPKPTAINISTLHFKVSQKKKHVRSSRRMSCGLRHTPCVNVFWVFMTECYVIY